MSRPLTPKEIEHGRKVAEQLAHDEAEHPERHGRSTGPYTFEYGPPETWRTRIPGILRDGQGRVVSLLGSRDINLLLETLNTARLRSGGAMSEQPILNVEELIDAARRDLLMELYAAMYGGEPGAMPISPKELWDRLLRIIGSSATAWPSVTYRGWAPANANPEER